ncbi:MAG: sulfatase [Deltaproteobacteria bacterium]|nr:sulfatase [Deltaproteobacteria bacterium]
MTFLARTSAALFRVPCFALCAVLSPVLWLSLVVGCAPSSDQPKPPNILFIAVDDLNDWTSVLQGHPQARTPNLDRLAARGLSFTNAHAAAPTCGPSRVSVMTSIRPSTSGNYDNPDTFTGNPMLNRAVLLPELFQQAGYQVTGAGKLFHGPHFENELRGRGFDEYWPSKVKYKVREPKERARPKPMADWGQGKKGFWDWGPMAPQITLDDMADGRLVNWVRDQFRSGEIQEPFFVGVGIIRPHLPFYAPQSYFDQYPLESIKLPEVRENDLADVPPAGRAMGIGEIQHDQIARHGQWRTAVQAYLATTTFADDCVGRILEGLQESGYADNTIVVLWTDHGWQLGEKKHWSKFSLWERSTRVNLIFAGPGVVAGSTSGAPVNLLDLYPTLAAMTGLEVPEQQIEGRDLTPLLAEPEREWPWPSITTYGYMNHTVRDRNWRYIRYRDGSEELYDHRRDSEEWTNLAGKEVYANVKAELAKAIPTINRMLVPGRGLLDGPPQ